MVVLLRGAGLKKQSMVSTRDPLRGGCCARTNTPQGGQSFLPPSFSFLSSLLSFPSSSPLLFFLCVGCRRSCRVHTKVTNANRPFWSIALLGQVHMVLAAGSWVHVTLFRKHDFWNLHKKLSLRHTGYICGTPALYAAGASLGFCCKIDQKGRFPNKTISSCIGAFCRPFWSISILLSARAAACRAGVPPTNPVCPTNSFLCRFVFSYPRICQDSIWICFGCAKVGNSKKAASTIY